LLFRRWIGFSEDDAISNRRRRKYRRQDRIPCQRVEDNAFHLGGRIARVVFGAPAENPRRFRIEFRLWNNPKNVLTPFGELRRIARAPRFVRSAPELRLTLFRGVTASERLRSHTQKTFSENFDQEISETNDEREKRLKHKLTPTPTRIFFGVLLSASTCRR